jgi:hypothetical protein
MALINASVDGNSVAPATPSTARPAMNMMGPVEYAVSTDAAPNAEAPPRSSRRRPTRSPSDPIVTKNPASTNP